ncbi:MAG TPA: Gfo/Idh/MocA family oxidoreductase [Candidatus Sulfopaludibacter sp.]|nr:Gfo/Idh/MocA family oxidoreductase [Candidatus Sulfopaludibacter sp.]
MYQSGSLNRRTLLRSAFAVSAGTALSAGRVWGANDRIRFGLIGSGGRGREDWTTFLKEPEVDPVAVCDVYGPFREKGIAIAEGRAKPFKDYRELLALKDIDAVIVATPDHWHSAITIAACEAGKDVYCEKPLSLRIAEGRQMVQAARKHNRVVQAGSQQRSGAHYAQAVKLIQDGGIGQVHRIDAGYQRNIFPGLKATEMAAGISPEFDYAMWLGPAPKRPFDPFRCIYNFRWFWDYSGGQMTNWGAHHLDIARWIVGMDAPTDISAFGGRYSLTDGGETPDIQQVMYQFGKVVVNWTSSEVAEGKPHTLDIFGTKGMLTLLRGGFQIFPEMKNKAPMMEPLQVKGADLNVQHARNFLDCLKSRKKPNADVEEGHRSATMCHLGNLSMRLGRRLKWDAAKEQVVGDPEANAMLG